MTREETIKVLAVLKAAYPAFYRGMKADELNGIVNLWASQFEGDDYKTVGAAVQAHIATDTKGYPPHIGRHQRGDPKDHPAGRNVRDGGLGLCGVGPAQQRIQQRDRV